MDSFDPDGVVLADPSDPNIVNPLKPSNRFHDLNGNGVQDQAKQQNQLQEREAYWYKDATQKLQFSPRIGLAFPITEKVLYIFHMVTSSSFLRMNTFTRTRNLN
jgi:hypothetical protein